MPINLRSLLIKSLPLYEAFRRSVGPKYGYRDVHSDCFLIQNTYPCCHGMKFVQFHQTPLCITMFCYFSSEYSFRNKSRLSCQRNQPQTLLILNVQSSLEHQEANKLYSCVDLYFMCQVNLDLIYISYSCLYILSLDAMQSLYSFPENIILELC